MADLSDWNHAVIEHAKSLADKCPPILATFDAPSEAGFRPTTVILVHTHARYSALHRTDSHLPVTTGASEDRPMNLLGLTVLLSSLIAPIVGDPPAASAPAPAWSPPSVTEVSRQEFSPPLPSPLVVRAFDHLEHNWDSGHRGVDLAGSENAEIRAAGSGVVVFAGFLVDRNVVSIEHSSGLRTTYLPVSPVVEVGDQVQRGQVIGTLETGHCLSACLHWGAKNGDRYYDPMTLLSPMTIRLYPPGP